MTDPLTCAVVKSVHGAPLPSHEAGWRIVDPEGVERLACDDHVSWLLNWDGGTNVVTALADG